MEEQQQIKNHRQPNYLGVFVVLAVLTVVEVGVTYLPIPRVPIFNPTGIDQSQSGCPVLYAS